MPILKLIIKFIGFFWLGIAFLSLYVPIFILSVIIQEMKELTNRRHPNDPPFSLNPFSNYMDHRKKQEKDSRAWIIKPLNVFFITQFNQLKNW